MACLSFPPKLSGPPNLCTLLFAMLFFIFPVREFLPLPFRPFSPYALLVGGLVDVPSDAQRLKSC